MYDIRTKKKYNTIQYDIHRLLTVHLHYNEVLHNGLDGLKPAGETFTVIRLSQQQYV